MSAISYSNILLGDEEILSEIYLVATKRIGRLVVGSILIVIGILISVFDISLGVLGIILILVGLYYILRKKKVKEAYVGAYLLTNKRAIEIELKGGMPRIIRSCSLYETTPVLRHVRQQSETTWKKGSSSTYQEESGDILFLKDGRIQVEFDDISSPSDMLKTVEVLLKSSNVEEEGGS